MDWVQVAVPAAHPRKIEVWATRKGEIVRRILSKPLGGTVTIDLPPFRRDAAVRLMRGG